MDLLMHWPLMTALSVVGLSVSMLLQRVLLAADKSDPYAYVVVFQGLAGLVTVGLAIVAGPDVVSMASALRHVWLPALACIVLYAAGHMLYAKTLQRVEASVFAVLFATHAVWMTIAGILFFGEVLRPLQIAGIVLLFASILVLVQRPRKLRVDSGLLLGLATGLLFGLAITCWSYVGRHVTDPLSWTAVSFIGPALLVLAVRPAAARAVSPFAEGGVLLRMLALTVFYAGGCAAMIYAYKYGDFSVVSPLRQSGVVLTVLLALVFLRGERRHIARKLTAAGLCLAGIVCVL